MNVICYSNEKLYGDSQENNEKLVLLLNRIIDLETKAEKTLQIKNCCIDLSDQFFYSNSTLNQSELSNSQIVKVLFGLEKETNKTVVICSVGQRYYYKFEYDDFEEFEKKVNKFIDVSVLELTKKFKCFLLNFK